MSIKRTVLSAHPMIRNTLLIVPLLLVVIFFFLRQGVSIQSFTIGGYQVEGLYLKLDKKLIANIAYLKIPKSKKKVDFSQLETVLDRIKALPKYFQYIALDRVDFTDNHYRIIYRDNVIYLSSDAYEVAGMLERKGEMIEARIPLLYIKKYNARLHGTLHYDYRQDVVQMEGNYTVANLAGHYTVIRKGNQAHFHLDSRSFGSLKPLVALAAPTPRMSEWLTRRITADAFRIKSLSGDLRLDESSFQLDPMQLAGQFEAQKAQVLFHDKLAKVAISKAKMDLKKNVIYFKPQGVSYAGRSLAGSSMYLTNLLGEKATKLHLDIHTDTRMDSTVDRVLKGYDITLPLQQTRGTAQARVVIDTVVGHPETSYQGNIELPESAFVVDHKKVTVHSGHVAFDQKHVALQAVDADMGWLRAKLTGEINLVQKRADLNADILQLHLGTKKNPFMRMRNKKHVPLHVEWGKGWRVALPLYQTVVTGMSHGFTVLCSDIRPLLPYLKGLPLHPGSGSIRLTTSDGQHYSYRGKIAWPSSYLYDKKGSITVYPFSGTYDGKSTKLTALNKRIRYDGRHNLLQLHHVYIDGKKALKSIQGKSSKKSGRLQIKGSDSLIRYEKYVLLTDRFDLRINGKSTSFVAHKDGDTVRVDLNGNAIVVKARRIKAPMLRALIHFGGLSGGRYSLDLQGNIKGTMRGVITLKGGTVSRFKTYNNMIALFNTVPALTTLSDPGFSQKGFEVKEGKIAFRILKDRIYFDMIYVDGKSAAISGKGTVSTRNGAINMDLAVRTARGIGKIIGSIPIVGYILMGKDKSITTGVKVTGTLENPKVTTHVVMETLLAPFKMMVRTLKSPAHIINK